MPRAKKTGPAVAFSEASTWNAVGEGWRQLFGGFRELGFSFEWHDFVTTREFDWAGSFHPGGLEVCLNLAGRATMSDGRKEVELTPRASVFYFQGAPPLVARRRGGERHRFITIEFSSAFLRENFGKTAEHLHPLIRAMAQGEGRVSEVTQPEGIRTVQLQLVESLRQCPVFKPAQALWFHAKAVELATHLFFRPGGEELFCTRAQRLARERVDRAQAVLREMLAEPPSLEELGRRVGCSPFYLSRLFSQEAGVTIQQFIRQIRMERAAELLRSGRCNVTEAAFTVGYNSLSHFSTAFHETFGCCPGLYPLRTTTQVAEEAK